VDYAQQLAADKSVDRKAQYRSWTPIASADFDQNYQAINSTYPGPTPGSYTARAGESLYGVAQAVWGDSTLWYLIAEANGLSSNTALKAGQVLTIPNKVTNVHNTSATTKVYNAGAAIGDTQPTMPDAPPPPKPKKSCGGLGMILMIVVAVVVTVYTAGAAAAYFAPAATVTAGAGAAAAGVAAGTTLATAGAWSAGLAVMAGGTSLGFAAGVAAAAVGGAMGSIASQLTGMATGDVDKFSWSSVAMGAIGAGVGAGFSPVAIQGASGTVNAALTAGRNSIITQTVGVAVGLQEKFDWRGVAASAVGAGISQGLTTDKWGQSIAATTMGGFGRRLLSGVLSGATKSAIYGQRPDWASIAIDSFGHAVSDVVVAKIQSADAASMTPKDAAMAAAQRDLAVLGAMTDGVGTGEPAMVLASSTGLAPNEAEAADFVESTGKFSVRKALQSLRTKVNAEIAENNALNKTWSEDSVADNVAVSIGRIGANGADDVGAISDLSKKFAKSASEFGKAVANGDVAGAKKWLGDKYDALSKMPERVWAQATSVASEITELGAAVRAITSDRQVRGEVADIMSGYAKSLGAANAALGAADLLYNVGMAMVGARLAKAGVQAYRAGNAVKHEAAAVEIVDDLFGALTKVADVTLMRRNVASALKAGMSRTELEAISRTAAVQSTRTVKEGAGVFHSIVRMQNQGWELIDKSFDYKSNNGVDLVFKKEGGRFAVVEAKYPDMGSLRDTDTQFGSRMQGSKDWNIDRLNRLIASTSASVDSKNVAKELLSAYRSSGNLVENYAAMARSDKLIRIDPSVTTKSTLSGGYTDMAWLIGRKT
jgi:LysM domain